MSTFQSFPAGLPKAGARRRPGCAGSTTGGRMLWAASTVLSLVGPVQLAAQNGTPARVIGRVYDQRRRLLAGVEVLVDGRELRATTDRAGFFTLTVTSSDSTVGFRRVGYRPIQLSLRPLPPSDDTVLVELVPSPVELPEIQVFAPAAKPLRYAGTTKYDEVFQRKKVGLGTFLMRDDLDRRFVMTTPELLQGVVGVRLSVGAPGARGQNDIRLVRCPDPAQVAVYVDGTRLIPGGEEDNPVVGMLNRVNPSDIEMIEIYRGPSQIPGVYHWDGCAVIALWTKWNK